MTQKRRVLWHSSKNTHTYVRDEEKWGNTEKAEGYEGKGNREVKGEHHGAIASEFHLYIFLTIFKYFIYLLCASH